MSQDIIEKYENIKAFSDIGFLKEYIDIKEENKEFIILFQIGDFYEIFFEDALLASNFTGLKLIFRQVRNVGKILCVGFKTSNSNHYIKQLLDNNIKVCVCKQINDGETIKRIVDRKYTKGTIFEDEFLNNLENNYILAIKQDFKEKDCISLVYADISTGQVFSTSDNIANIMLEINKINPNEMLVLSSQKEAFKLNEQLNIVYLDENYDNLSAFSILVKYCSVMNLNYLPQINKPVEYQINSFLVLDQTTRQNLELSRTKSLLKKKGSLLWFLNNTMTLMGFRALKKILSEPLVNKNEILNRQKTIQELIDNKDKLDKIREQLSCFSDLMRSSANLSNKTIMPKDLISISLSVEKIQSINQIVQSFESKLLKLNQNNIDKIIDFSELILASIENNSIQDLKSSGIIKDGFNCELDYLRQKLSEKQTEILKYEQNLKTELKSNRLSIKKINSFGYFIEVPKKEKINLPSDFLLKQSLANSSRYTNSKLNKLCIEINSLWVQICNLEYDLYSKIRENVAQYTNTIRELGKNIALIDVFCSFAICAIQNNFVMPKFNYSKISIINGYHPSLIKLRNEIVKNDTELKNGEMIILSGANMSGKSTYIRHNALICILAQIGSFVPADSADLTILDKIFLRQSANDDIINNNSTFMVEMNDFKYILDNLTNNSLVLFDEPAKSTNEKESASISCAYFEYILSKFKAKTIIVTHNKMLTSLEDKYPNNVKNYKIGETVKNSIIMDRKIKRGVIEKSNAINTAILADLPKEIIEQAIKNSESY